MGYVTEATLVINGQERSLPWWAVWPIVGLFALATVGVWLFGWATLGFLVAGWWIA